MAEQRDGGILSGLTGLAAGVIGGSRQGTRDVLVSMLPQFIGVATGFVTSILLARGLGPDGLGRFSLVLSLAAVAGSLSDLGIGQTAVRYASRAAAKGDLEGHLAVLRWAFRLRIAMVAVVTVCFVAAAPLVARFLWHDAALSPLMQLGLAGGVFAALTAVPSLYFMSLKRFGTNALVSSAQRLVSFAGIVLLAALQQWSLLLVLVVTLGSSALAASAMLWLVPKAALWRRGGTRLKDVTLRGLLRDPAVRPDPAPAGDDTPTGFLAFNLVSTVLVMLILQADMWLMGYFLAKSQVGIYSVAMRFTLPLTIVLGALNTALWPRASAVSGVKEALPLLRRTFKLSLMVSGAGVVYAIVVPLLAPFLFGARYSPAVLLGQVLCIRYCLAILVCPVALIGYSFGLVRVYWIVNLVQLAVVLTINVLFLPVIGPLAAALALVANDLLNVLLIGSIIWRKVRCGEKGPDVPPA